MGSAPFTINKVDLLHGLKVLGYALLSTVLTSLPALADNIQVNERFAAYMVIVTPVVNSLLAMAMRWVQDRRSKLE